jgi:hypothetical protein
MHVAGIASSVCNMHSSKYIRDSSALQDREAANTNHPTSPLALTTYLIQKMTNIALAQHRNKYEVASTFGAALRAFRLPGRIFLHQASVPTTRTLRNAMAQV